MATFLRVFCSRTNTSRNMQTTYSQMKLIFKDLRTACSLLQVPQAQNMYTCRTLRSSVDEPIMVEAKSARYSTHLAQQVIADDPYREEDNITTDVIAKVNEQIENRMCGRMFAVVRIFSKQFKVTTEDIIILQNHFVPRCGERICFDKVLLVGSADFTLLGRPLLSKDLVRVEATVIEKTLSHVITNFLFVKRKGIRRLQFRRIPLTMLRINSIEVKEPLNKQKTVEGLEGRIV